MEGRKTSTQDTQEKKSEKMKKRVWKQKYKIIVKFWFWKWYTQVVVECVEKNKEENNINQSYKTQSPFYVFLKWLQFQMLLFLESDLSIFCGFLILSHCHS